MSFLSVKEATFVFEKPAKSLELSTLTKDIADIKMNQFTIDLVQGVLMICRKYMDMYSNGVGFMELFWEIKKILGEPFNAVLKVFPALVVTIQL